MTTADNTKIITQLNNEKRRKNENLPKTIAIEVGDFVRVKKDENIFTKGYDKGYSTNKYRVVAINNASADLFDGKKTIKAPRKFLLKVEGVEAELLSQAPDIQVVQRQEVKQKRVLKAVGIEQANVIDEPRVRAKRVIEDLGELKKKK